MNIKSLQQLVRQGESETLEFKRSTGQRTEAMKTVCAMLNGAGGFVLFGITDKNEIVGQQVNSKTLEEIANEIARIEPPVFPDIERIVLDDDKSVVLLCVKGAVGRPYAYDGRSYQRSGSTTRIMPRVAYEKILLEKLHANYRWENQPTDKIVSLYDLDEEEIQNTVDEAIRLGRLESLKNRELSAVLKGLGLIHNDKLLNAAVVLYGKNVELQTIYPQCAIRLARFRGINRLADFTDNRQYWGHAFGLLRRAETFLQDHVPIAGRLVPGKMQREDRPLYLPLATREALANAFCHRDYTLGGGTISVGMYDDRLEIISPGSLHFGLTPEMLKVPHESHPWNPIIASVFYRAGIIEKWGSGTTKIIDWCYEGFAPTPEWSDRKIDTVVTFYPAEEFEQSEKTAQLTPQLTPQLAPQVTPQVIVQILRFCQEPRKVNEIQALLNLKDRKNFIRNYLRPLLTEELIALTIPNKPRSRLQRYIITEKGRVRFAMVN